MINWEKENDEFYTVIAEAENLTTLEQELTETITKIIELQLFISSKIVEFYLDATNGSYFIYEVENNGDRIDESITVHFCALKIWEDYTNSLDFETDMIKTLENSVAMLKSHNILLPFPAVIRDEMGHKYEI